jgi:2-polyprenyl-3-methyl-5-hydroxy-6-metoxy-1,4-benzoquinol methylase
LPSEDILSQRNVVVTGYDKQYQVEENLFGSPYEAFETFVSQQTIHDGKALDLGCGQGRDALMLARYGYAVTGVDSSQVGIQQMLDRANAEGLAVTGVVADLFEYQPTESFDAVVLDSILHFGKADKSKELGLLDKLVAHINVNGVLFLFVHRAKKKEQELHNWFERVKPAFEIAQAGYIDYIYQEMATGFQSEFQYYMMILRRVSKG